MIAHLRRRMWWWRIGRWIAQADEDVQLVEEGEDLICIAEIDIPDSLPYGGCGSFSLEGGRDA